jgi:glycosyltransferase involved in cell wall biosynthesis
MKLSIIVPTLQEEKILGDMLPSVRKLKDFDYELIVSDGHSTDRTVEIARKYADKVIVHDGLTRQTIAAGRNAGARAALGEYLVFIDGDVFVPNINQFFKEALARFERDPKLAALTVRLKTLPDYENFFDRINWFIVSAGHWFTNNVIKQPTASGEFQMFRRSPFWEIGGYNESLVVGEDIDIFKRISKIGRTRLDWSLFIYHTSRRAHNMGWFKLLFIWVMNMVSNIFRGKSFSKEWKVSR